MLSYQDAKKRQIYSIKNKKESGMKKILMCLALSVFCLIGFSVAEEITATNTNTAPTTDWAQKLNSTLGEQKMRVEELEAVIDDMYYGFMREAASLTPAEITAYDKEFQRTKGGEVAEAEMVRSTTSSAIAKLGLLSPDEDIAAAAASNPILGKKILELLTNVCWAYGNRTQFIWAAAISNPELSADDVQKIYEDCRLHRRDRMPILAMAFKNIRHRELLVKVVKDGYNGYMYWYIAQNPLCDSEIRSIMVSKGGHREVEIFKRS